MYKFTSILIRYSLNTYADLGRVIAHSIVLLFMLEKLNKALDKGLYTGILLTDLSKAFDSISHDLLIAKFNSYDFSKNSLNLMNDYLSGRKQRTKIGDNFSSYREILYGVSSRFYIRSVTFQYLHK